MNAGTKFAVVSAFAVALLWGCAQLRPHPMPMETAVQNAKTKADHEALAIHYDTVADQFEQKVEEHKEILRRYEAAPYLYGKQGLTFATHCENLIRVYAQAEDENRELAKLHRRMAEEIQ